MRGITQVLRVIKIVIKGAIVIAIRMKQKIKELALEAGGSHYPDVGGKTLEAFAELLVKECMALCDETQADYFKHRKSAHDFAEKNIYAEGESASDIIKYKIKKHFEIE